MTLTNGASGGGNPGGMFSMPTGFDAANFSATTNIQLLLQTNNDLILAIHKSIVDSTQELNRKIETLRDDIRDIKLNQQKNDRTLQEEANNWRSHVEALLKEQGDRHLQDTARLQDMLMKLVIGQPLTAPLAPTAPMFIGQAPLIRPPQPSAMAMPMPQTKPDYMQVQAPPQFQQQHQPSYEPIVAKPNVTIPANASALAPITSSNNGSTNLFGIGNKSCPEAVSAPITTTAAATPITFGFGAGSVDTKVGGNLMSKPAPQQQFGSTAGAAKDFSFKQQQEPVGFRPAMGPATTTTTVGAGFFSTSTAANDTPKTDTKPETTTTFGSNGGSSLFGGGGNKTGTNTFANLAAKAAETGGGFLGGGQAAAKPQFGVSGFGAAKDFKLFGGSPQSLNTSSRHSAKASEEHAGGEEESDKDETDDYTPDVHYEPVVPLPPEVEVVSGEEGEEVVYVSRCKLYRFDRESKENKERGLGDIKILFNPNTQKYRCVMRREKVLKLCANFPIVGDLKLHQREQMPTVYTWACKDFSEDPAAGSDETFSARFKDVAIASEFNKKMTEAIEKMN